MIVFLEFLTFIKLTDRLYHHPSIKNIFEEARKVFCLLMIVSLFSFLVVGHTCPVIFSFNSATCAYRPTQLIPEQALCLWGV